MWVDKSVYADGDTATLNSRNEAGSSFEVSLKEDEAFQVIFSVLGSSMTTTTKTSSTGPMDVVLVLDTSTSMDDEDNAGVTRLQRTIEAANDLLDDLLTINGVRIAIVTYNRDSETVLPLAQYKDGINLVVTNYYNNGSSDAGVVYAYNDKNVLIGKDSGYTQGTNLQSGIDRGFNLLANATDVEGRAPVAIVLTDGQANRTSKEGFYELSSHSDKDGTGTSGRNLYLSTLLNAAYTKTKIEENYSTDATVYTVGVDVSGNTVAQLLMNPADSSYGFYDYGDRRQNTEITQAYRNFQRWASGQVVTYNEWVFDHNYPAQNGAITAAKIAANIYYADTYYDASNAELSSTFDQIFEELSSGAFNPISSSTTVDGATGVDDTPLIYVDFIGSYMEVKEIEAVTLFGASYGIVNNGDGTYTVAVGTGVNPTTNEKWNTSEDIRITVTKENGVQKLEIRINQEILPILMEQVYSNTVGGTTTATITEFLYDPLRVYYTVGIDSDILLPNGQIDVSEMQGYPHIDNANGTVSFYSNQFGVENPANNNIVTAGDAHVGFRPSAENRYYYHQANQRIFSAVTKADGSAVQWEEDLYGVIYKEGNYNLTDIDYATYLQFNADYDRTQDPVNHQIYTYVSFYRPTTDQTDAANAAELVTYLVYTNWSDLRESVAFYDAGTKKYVNYTNGAYTLDDVGYVMTAEQIAAYVAANPTAEIYAVLGMGSLRTSHFHNMIRAKTANLTDTATLRYDPEYTHDTAADHHGNDVVVWLGNNGKLTVAIDTGIALTKRVTENIGNADDTYALTVTVPSGVNATPVVKDTDGNAVGFSYTNNVLAVNVKANETVYISGIPGGTTCSIGEVVSGDYYIASQTDTVRIPMVSEVLNGAVQYAAAVVTNAPNKYGNLFITKEITSDHAVPDSVLNTPFYITVNVGTALAGKTLTVEDSAHSAPYSVTVDNNGNMVFTIKARQTIEIMGLPAGTAVTVTESDPGTNFTISYRTRNHSGEAADTDNALVIPADGSATAVVVNHYTPHPVSVDLDIVGTKNFTIEGNHNGGTFYYKVQKWNGSAWEDINGKTAETAYAANESGTKTFAISDVLAGITYTQVGSHAYQVLEVRGNVANVTYDGTLYTFTVAVTDNGGQLVATVTDLNNTAITDGSYEVTFHNTYHTAPISMDITKVVENKSGDPAVSAQGFQFKSYPVDANGNRLSNGYTETVTNTIYSDAAGNARISGVYTQTGTYFFAIVEDAMSPYEGIVYDRAQHNYIVTVRDHGTGKLEATVRKVGSNTAVTGTGTVNAATANFVNATFDEVVEKEVFAQNAPQTNIDGKKVNAGEILTYFITYTNYTGNDVVVDIMDTIPKHTSYVEGSASHGGTYAGTNINWRLNVAAGESVTVSFEASVDTTEVIVTNTAVIRDGINTYTTNEVVNHTIEEQLVKDVFSPDDLTVSIDGKKVYEGDELLYKVSFTNANAAAADIKITDKIPANTTYAEGSASDGGVYSNGQIVWTLKNVPAWQTITVSFKVTVNGDLGAVTIENKATATDGTNSFETDLVTNYTVADEVEKKVFAADNTDVSIDGKKVYEGDELVYTIRYRNTADAATTVTITDSVPRYTTYVKDSADNGGVYDNGVITWTKEVQAGEALTVSFKVTVNEDIADKTIRNEATIVEGKNTYTTNEVTNYTVDDEVKKDVFFADNTNVSINGKKVYAGDILVYTIRYTNGAAEKATVKITDTIAEHTTYIDGSADNGGVYADGSIAWELEVAPGATITVTFKVAVKENAGAASITNKAVVLEGKNTYETNEVTNYTTKDEVHKQVFHADAPTVNIDGKPVAHGDTLIYAISYKNTASEKTTVTILDTVPSHTAYVEGSADNGGVYKDGVITWTLDVEAGDSITVSFKVKVAGAEGGTIKNEAVILEGKNTYTTNNVSNPTEDDTLDVPQTGDSSNMAMWIALMLVSSGAALVLCTCDKRKTRQVKM